MNERLFIIIVFLFTLFFSAGYSYAKEPTQNYIISSGSHGGNYNKTGIIISELLNKIDEESVFTSVASNGSIENIDRLKSRFTDFAIVQQDVLLNNFYGDKDGIRNIKILFPLFQEKFIIYTHGDSPIPFSEFKQRVETSEDLKVGITSKEGSSYKTFVSISELLETDTDKISFVVDDYTNLVEKFQKKEIDFLITFSLPIEALQKEDNISVVYFNERQISLLRSRMRHLSESDFNNSDYKTLGVWSLFVGLDSSVDKIGEASILENLQKINERDDFISKEIQKSLEQFRQNKNWYNQYLSEMPTSPYLLKALGYQTNNYQKYFIISVLILLFFSVAFFLKTSEFYKKFGWTYLWMRYRHIFISLVIISILYLLCIEGLLFGEKQLFMDTSIKSQILDMTRKDIHFWNLIRNFTGNDNGIFPISSFGKIMVSVSAYSVYFGMVLVAFLEFSMYKLTVKRKKGLMNINYKNHIIIAGWNESTPKFIQELLLASKDYYNQDNKIVCVVSNPEDIAQKDSYISNLEQKRKITFVDGHIRHKKTLEQSNAHLAKTIILLAEDNTIASDERTLLRTLSVSKFCKEKISIIAASNAERNVNTTYIIAQTNSDEFTEDFMNAGVNGIINTARIGDGILIQSILNHGISKLLNEVLFFNDRNEFYTVDLLDTENAHLRYKTFDELLLPLRQQNILLLAVKVVYYDNDHNEIVDENKILQKLNKENLERQIIVNPITETEINRKTDGDDQLVVFATNERFLKKGIQNVQFKR